MAFLLLGPAALFMISALMRRRVTVTWSFGAALWVSVAWIVSMGLVWQPLMRGQESAVAIAVTNLIAATSAWDSVFWLRQHPHFKPHRYYIWWSLFWASLLGIALTQNLALAWIAVEFSTLTSAALIIELGDSRALEAAWKYILIASVGLVMGLIGIVFLYASLKSQALGWATLDYQNLHAQFRHVAPIVRTLAAIFIVAGFGTKAGLVPFHTWLPDAHSEAPSPVSGLLSGVLLGLALFTVFRFVSAIPAASGVWMSGPHLLMLFGTLSLVVGSLAILVQSDVKRLLAYSSIEQIGMIAVALGIGTKAALSVALLQFALHGIIKSSLFYGAGHLSILYQTKRLRKITGLVTRHPGAAMLWSLGILALAGLPPLGLAYSEWLIFLQLWQHRDYLVIGVTAAALTLTFAALAYHLIRTLWGDFGASGQDSAAAAATREVV